MTTKGIYTSKLKGKIAPTTGGNSGTILLLMEESNMTHTHATVQT